MYLPSPFCKRCHGNKNDGHHHKTHCYECMILLTSYCKTCLVRVSKIYDECKACKAKDFKYCKHCDVIIRSSYIKPVCDACNKIFYM